MCLDDLPPPAMAFAMIGGIAVAILLTLLFLSALYVAWYRLKEPTPEPTR
jgi:multidrug efflux pump